MESKILDALRLVKDPDLGRDLVSLGFIKDLKVCGGIVSFKIELTTPACPVREQMKEQAYRNVMAVPGVTRCDITLTAKVRSNRPENSEKLLPKVRNIVPVASGKGGVGKSTVSANLAVALSRMGARVGLLDGDLYGPTIPALMGPATGPPDNQSDRFIPPVCHGVKMTSFGFFMRPGEVAIMRGPMLHKTLEFFLSQVDWGELDYLIVDLPPGTGDIQLSLCQMIPVTGALVVSTPQDIALQIAEKAILMFEKLNTPVLGLLENMSGYVCRHCGKKDDIFGVGGAKRYAMEHGIPFLGEVPLSTDVREASDSGVPLVVSHPDSPSAKAFMKVAENLAAQISIRASGAGADSSGPVPLRIAQPTPHQLLIEWSDGHTDAIDAFDLRTNCPCAECVNETTGERILDPSKVDKDIRPVSFHPVGRYAIQFEWSDGHSSGIYAFERIRKLGKPAKVEPRPVVKL